MWKKLLLALSAKCLRQGLRLGGGDRVISAVGDLPHLRK